MMATAADAATSTEARYEVRVIHGEDPHVELWRHGILIDVSEMHTVGDLAEWAALVTNEALAIATATEAMARGALARILSGAC